MAAGSVSKVRPHRHHNGADGNKHEREREYGLLVPAEPAGDLAAAEIQERGDGHEATKWIED